MKPAQRDLFGNEPDEHDLTPRQRLVFDLVRTTPGGVTADEAGAAWHAAKGKHPAGERCDWCADTGVDILRSKALGPLVIRRQGGMWQPRRPQDAVRVAGPAREPTEAELQANPFTGLEQR